MSLGDLRGGRYGSLNRVSGTAGTSFDQRSIPLRAAVAEAIDFVAARHANQMLIASHTRVDLGP